MGQTDRGLVSGWKQRIKENHVGRGGEEGREREKVSSYFPKLVSPRKEILESKVCCRVGNGDTAKFSCMESNSGEISMHSNMLRK